MQEQREAELKPLVEKLFSSRTAWCFSTCCSLSVFLTFVCLLSFSSSSVSVSVFVFFFFFTFLFWLFLFLSFFSCFGLCFGCLYFVFLAYSFLHSLLGSFFSFGSFFPVLSAACGALVLQVANQSAVSQEQVDNILQENDALRTNLAALEQVKKRREHHLEG